MTDSITLTDLTRAADARRETEYQLADLAPLLHKPDEEVYVTEEYVTDRYVLMHRPAWLTERPGMYHLTRAGVMVRDEDDYHPYVVPNTLAELAAGYIKADRIVWPGLYIGYHDGMAEVGASTCGVHYLNANLRRRYSNAGFAFEPARPSGKKDEALWAVDAYPDPDADPAGRVPPVLVMGRADTDSCEIETRYRALLLAAGDDSGRITPIGRR